jgi:parallel beta-helix repeat protein
MLDRGTADAHRHFATLFLFIATPALATDGVLEINQTCAVQTGCFSGDGAGWPVTIDASGSYRLTSDLSGIGANLDGIFLNKSRITLDFNGFALVGPSIGGGSGRGVAGGGTNGSVAGFATIKNGIIRGFRSDGILLDGAKGVRVQNMTLDFNAGRAIGLGDEARIVNSGISNNGSSQAGGLFAGSHSLILNNVVVSSGGNGIEAGSGSTVSGNISSDNRLDGIFAFEGSTVSDNTVFENGRNGIHALEGSIVQRNTARMNGQSGSGFGLRVFDSGYSDNVISSPVTLTRGTVSPGLDAGGNVCNFSLTCP